MADLERRVTTLKDCYSDKQVRARAARLKAEPTVNVVNAASEVRNAFITIFCSIRLCEPFVECSRKTHSWQCWHFCFV